MFAESPIIVFSVQGGLTDIQREILGREILGKSPDKTNKPSVSEPEPFQLNQISFCEVI
jgi:hypothetical protein